MLLARGSTPRKTPQKLQTRFIEESKKKSRQRSEETSNLRFEETSKHLPEPAPRIEPQSEQVSLQQMNRQQLRDYGKQHKLTKCYPEYRRLKFGEAPRKRYSEIGALDLRGFLIWVRERVAPTPAPAPVPAPRTRTRPAPAPRTTIRQTSRALTGYTNSYSLDPLVQLNKTRKALEKFVRSKRANEGDQIS